MSIGNPADDARAFVARVLPTIDVPGLALLVVKHGATVLAEGFGEARAGEQTFIAVAIADFVDRGVVRWDTPVRKLMPEFETPSAYLSTHATLGDLLAHRTGLGDYVGDGLWELGSFGGSETALAERLRYLEPALPLGTTFECSLGDGGCQFQYSNLGYALATACLERLTNGTAWHVHLRERFWQPLGMSDTFGSPALVPAAQRSRLAAGHGWCMQPDGHVAVRPFDLLDARTPTILAGFRHGAFGAGSVVTSARD